MDEGLYSRQLYVLGVRSQRSIQKARVLVTGLSGLGVEICKNLALTGIGKITVHDCANASDNDYHQNFFLTARQVGENRCHAVVDQLASLNPNVTIQVISDEAIEESLVAAHDVVVAVDVPRTIERQLSQWARSHNCQIVFCGVRGGHGFIFCDFADDFVVSDPDGESPKQIEVGSVTEDERGHVVVTCLDGGKQPFDDGDLVHFDGEAEARRVTPLGPFAFSVNGPSPEKTVGRTITQLKQPTRLNHRPIDESEVDADFVLTDWADPQSSHRLHAAFRSLSIYEEEHGRSDRPLDAQDFSDLYKIGRDRFEHADWDTFSAFVRDRGRVPSASVDAFLGGVAAQEVVKAITHKFTPLGQWLYFTAGLDPSKELALNQLYNARIFVVGAGVSDQDHCNLDKCMYLLTPSVLIQAIGCELLKNLSLLGAGSGENGMIFVTDDDRIEKSNLSRQFLFRPSDVGKPKSSTAAAAIKHLRPSTNIKAYEVR